MITIDHVGVPARTPDGHLLEVMASAASEAATV